MLSRVRALLIITSTSVLAGCITTSMQGYADRELPKKSIGHIVAYVAAPPALAASIQSSIVSEAKSHGVFAEDALTILPPTRTYTNSEIQKALQASGVDGVLIVKTATPALCANTQGHISNLNRPEIRHLMAR
jgi:ABC-type sugar transport system substrate-binding protein